MTGSLSAVSGEPSFTRPAY